MTFLRLLSCGVIIGALASCNPPDSKKRTYETLVFDVDQTRLEPAITDAMSLNTPFLKSTTLFPEMFAKTNFDPFAERSTG